MTILRLDRVAKPAQSWMSIPARTVSADEAPGAPPLSVSGASPGA